MTYTNDMGRGSRTHAQVATKPRSLGQEDYRDEHHDAFALSVHKLTGWPIIKLASGPNERAEHFVIEHPSGQVIDAYGVREIEEVLDEYHFESGLNEFEASFDELINHRPDSNQRAIAANALVYKMLVN